MFFDWKIVRPENPLAHLLTFDWFNTVSVVSNTNRSWLWIKWFRIYFLILHYDKREIQRSQITPFTTSQLNVSKTWGSVVRQQKSKSAKIATINAMLSPSCSLTESQNPIHKKLKNSNSICDVSFVWINGDNQTLK